MDALDRTGLIVLGKSATPEFGLSPTTEPLVSGPTRNPWDLTRSAGGSSGGAAAAVAAGIVPFAHGNDGGGSIRIPAACCGLFGFKPSRGRMIGARGETRVTDLGVQHALTRSVRDSAALFAATEDAAPGARYPAVGLVTAPAWRRLRVGVVVETALGEAPAPEIAKAVQDVAHQLAGLGHQVQPTRWPVDGPQFRDDFLLLWAAGARDAVDEVARAIGRAPDENLLEPFTLGLAEMARRAPAEAVPQAVRRLETAAIEYDTWFVAQQFDVVLSPVLARLPPPIGLLAPNVPFETLIERLTAYVGYTPLHNVAGAPAMSAPLAWTADGRPIGTMFAARRGAERTLFELGYELEAAWPWTSRVPSVHAQA
jgi:amidase